LVSKQFSQEEFVVFVCASTECFPDLSLDGALNRLVDLEFTAAEIDIHESGNHLKPSRVLADLEGSIAACRATYRLTVAAYSIEIDAEGPAYLEQFAACCKLAKATKVVCLVVPSSELGTPFNAEIERLRDMVAIASREGVLVALKTQVGRMTQTPDNAVVMCDQVKGLGLTLDPSHYICGPHAGGNYDQVMKHVLHVQLRDTTPDKFQVRVGQGVIEYSRLITQLSRLKYQRALSVHITEMPEVDHVGELRKMRLLLESML
jgi:sugar phosphate isomerase/epimerase